MTPAAWIALASFALALSVQAAIFAYRMGKTDQRVATLEQGGAGTAKMVADMAEVKADVRHMSKSIDDLKGQLSWATDIAPPRPTRSRTSK